MFYLADFSKPTKKEKKISQVMREFKNDKLHIGGTKKKVKNRKQAIAIALSESKNFNSFSDSADFAKKKSLKKEEEKKKTKDWNNWEKAREIRSGISTAQRVSQDVRGWLSTARKLGGM